MSGAPGGRAARSTRAVPTTVGRDGARHPQPRPPRRARRRACARSPSGAYADRALHGEARDLDAARPRAGQAARLRHGPAAPHARPRHRRRTSTASSTRACAPRCSSGSSSCCSSTASPTTPRSPRRSSWPSPAPATGSSTPCCAASQREGVELPSDDDAGGRGDPPLAPASGSSSCGGTGSGPTRPARCWRPTTSRPSSRCASTRWPSTYDARRRRRPPRGRGDRRRRARSTRSRHPGYAAGAFTPQSRAGQLVARAVEPQPGERVLDLCAAPGGKTTHLAALMGGEGEVVAVERHPSAPRALQRTCARMRARNVTVVTPTRRRPTAPRGFDRVLLDPPCSGLGTLRSHPDLRWRDDARRPIDAPGRRAGRDPARGARARWRPGARSSTRVCTLSPRRGAPACARRRAAHASRTAMAPTASILPAMEAEVTSGCSARPAASRGCGPRTWPGRYRCVYCLHRFELRSVCPDCGEHSTIVRMSSTATLTCNHCEGSMLVEV